MFPLSVAIVAFDGISPFHLSVPCMVFEALPDHFSVQVCMDRPGENNFLTTSSHFKLADLADISILANADLIIIPSWYYPYQKPDALLCDLLQQAHQGGARLAGLCLGAFAIAATGLLQGKQATTHWQAAEDFNQFFPEIDLQADILYMEEDRILTSAGTAAALDCCLHIVRELLGSQQANQLARLFVVPPHRQGGQAQFIDQPMPVQISDQKLSQLIDWMQANLSQSLNLDMLAGRVAMSRRNFSRKFKSVTGKSVGNWLLDQRLAYSQILLENSALSIEIIADQAGFGSVMTFRHHFKQKFSVTPQQWRQIFKGAQTD